MAYMNCIALLMFTFSSFKFCKTEKIPSSNDKKSTLKRSVCTQHQATGHNLYLVNVKTQTLEYSREKTKTKENKGN